ncbi:MAG: hypothetical protein ACI4L6_01505 [Candidatus Onthoplasma sp.]
MKCRNRFCYFNRKGDICLKENITLNEIGVCMSFFYSSYYKITDSVKDDLFDLKTYDLRNAKKNELKNYNLKQQKLIEYDEIGKPKIPF